MRGDRQPMHRYIRVSEKFGRPGIAAFGARFLLDSTSYQGNDTVARTELLPHMPPELAHNAYQTVRARPPA